jgi:hypothetical protein
MPWRAKGKEIVRADTGKVVGHSKSNAMAEAAVRARYANTKPEDKKIEAYRRIK